MTAADPAVDGDGVRSGAGTRRRDRLFGDRVGLALFLGALCWFALTWRVGFFISDTYAVANTLVNVASGHLYIDHIQYSLSLGSSQPGLQIFEGTVYGRNYGQVYASLPLYWLLEALSAVVELRIAAAGTMSLLLLACVTQVGSIVDRRPAAILLGSVVAIVVFVVNVLWARSLDPQLTGLLALQGTMAVAGGFVGVLLYRLVAAIADRRVGLGLGTIAVVATPVGFWATIPKRHVMTAAFTMAVLYGFYVSRRRTDRRGLLARGGAYAAAGLAASIHGGEGAVLVFVLAVIDLLSAPSNGHRALTAAFGGLLIGLAPYLVTNTLISGSPFLSPRWLRPFSGGSIGPGGQVQRAVAPVGVAAAVGVLGIVETLWDLLANAVRVIWRYVSEGLAAVGDPERLYHVFVRSGHIDGVAYGRNDYEVIELTVLESMPILGGMVAAVSLAAERLRSAPPLDGLDRAIGSLRSDPVRQTDLLALALVGGLTVPYLPRLPLFSQITVRYLLPTMPLWLYLLGRLPPVRTALSTRFHHAAGAYLLCVTVGGVVLVGSFAWLGVAIGEAMQLHALVNLALAASTGGALLIAARWERPVVGAIAIGVAAAATTLLVGLAGLEYFAYGRPLLPITRLLSGLVPLF